MGRHLMSLDEEMNKHLEGILKNLENLGIKNATKTDALRVVINMNKASNLRVKRKNRTKPNIGGIDFF